MQADELSRIDFWGAVMSNYEHVASTQRASMRALDSPICLTNLLRASARELSRAIQQGIPPALRGMTWQLMSYDASSSRLWKPS